MSRNHLIRCALIVATICFIVTALTTDHTITTALSGLLLGYCIGLHDPARRRT